MSVLIVKKSNRLELFQRFKITEGRRTCVSLFSGILGLEMGLNQSGFSTRLAIDVDESAKDTVNFNFPELDYLIKSISNVAYSSILERTRKKKRELDLLSGGPPCQPFSTSGLRRGLNDRKGMLFEYYVEVLEGLEPKAFILENVRGMTSTRKGVDLKYVLKKLEKTGYTLYWKVLDAANYGVPQFRQRLFIVGFRDQLRFSFPELRYGPFEEIDGQLERFVTVQDAIGDLIFVKDYPLYHGKYAHLLKDIPEGLNYSYYCKERGHSRPLFKWRSKFWYFLLKIDRNRPSLTIQANPGNNTGPFHWRNRKLSISELKRLQTIPDWFIMKGSYNTKRRHVGNAVPPVLAHKLGIEIARALDEEIHLNRSEIKEHITKENKLYKIKSGRRSGKGKLCVVNGKDVILMPTNAKHIS